MERPSSTVNNRVADGFSCGASAFCALADATPIRHTRPKARAKPCPPLAFIGASSCALAPLVERLRKRKRSLLENICGWGLAMELALSVTTAAGSALLGCWLDSQGRSIPGQTFTLECSTGTGAYPFSRHNCQRGNLLLVAYG